MIPADSVLVALAIAGVAGLAAGVWLGIRLCRWRHWLNTPLPKAPAARPPGTLGMEPTAVYLPFDRYGRLLYTGIAANPQRRAAQHADDKAWACDVDRVEAWWFPDRYAALAVEWFAIRYLDPVHNVAPSGSCDAWTEKRPSIRPARVRWPHARARMASLRRVS